MSKQHLNKQQKEQFVFEKFLEARGIHHAQFCSRPEPEPDILYTEDIYTIAYELIEICSEEEKKAHHLIKKGSYIRPSSSYIERFKAKFDKIYLTDYPIELICYSSVMTQPEEIVILDLNQIIQMKMNIQFEKIWFLSNELYCLYSRK